MVWLHALAGAWPQWQGALVRIGPGHALFALGYGACASLAFFAGRAARSGAGDAAAWFIAAALLAAMGLNAILQFDVLLLQFVRLLARLQGWYDARHGLQYALVGLVTAIGLAVLARLRTTLRADWPICAPAVIGALWLASLTALRVVSFHATDAMLNLRLAGVSLARLSELAALALCAHGAVRRLRAR